MLGTQPIVLSMRIQFSTKESSHAGSQSNHTHITAVPTNVGFWSLLFCRQWSGSSTYELVGTCNMTRAMRTMAPSPVTRFPRPTLREPSYGYWSLRVLIGASSFAASRMTPKSWTFLTVTSQTEPWFLSANIMVDEARAGILRGLDGQTTHPRLTMRKVPCMVF